MKRFLAILPLVLSACAALPGIGSVGPVPGRFNAGLTQIQDTAKAAPTPTPSPTPSPKTSPSTASSPVATSSPIPTPTPTPTPSPTPYNGPFVSTLVYAGTNGPTYVSAPAGVAVAASGSVYISENAGDIRVETLVASGSEYYYSQGPAIGAGPGNLNGSATVAQFRGPKGLAFDGSGNLFVADSGNHEIRRVSPGGDVTTYAGSGTGGWADGAASSAEFNVPSAVAVDSQGNVYVADTNNHCIRMITPGGIVSTLAGQHGVPGFADGPASTALFTFPAGVAVDSQGNVYVADSGNHRIREITGGTVRTLAGNGIAGWVDGPGASAEFHNPGGIVIDSSGSVVVADTYNQVIRAVLSSGIVTTLAGDGHQGFTDGANEATSSAEFKYPEAVTTDAQGIVYIADTENNLLRFIVPRSLR